MRMHRDKTKKARSHSGFQQAMDILAREKANVALMLGNGINLTSRGSRGISWDKLMENLITLAAANFPVQDETAVKLRRLLQRGANGETAASWPEVFDFILATGKIKPELRRRTSNELKLQSMIAQMLKEMKPGPPHRAVANWAAQFRVPILTTNYDHCFQDALASDVCKRHRFGNRKPLTDLYPWDRYYAPSIIGDPADSFAIWHIHGDRALRRSIRAGLDQYMGMVQRLRKLKLPVAKEILSGPDEDQRDDPAFHAAPWLRTFMGKKLWIQGLGLRSAEVSIRWLLIQRLRYWRRFRAEHRHENGWYVHGPTDKIGQLDEQRRSFFEGLGLKVIEIAKPNEVYLDLFVSNQKIRS